ncbi:MAG: hypothetical protein M3Z92_06275 [Bacteroidota bacterium]|nr:hypothetical protein [Bacteroidota bacterium]
MRIILLLVFAQLILKNATSQNNKSFRVNSIEKDSSDLALSVYRYPAFQKGIVSFSHQPLASAMLNYNNLSGQVLFLTPEGEMLEIASPETLQYIAIGSDTFHYVEKGYVQMLTHYPEYNLGKKELIKYNGKEMKGAYGTYSSTTAASSINRYSDQNLNQKIPIDENTLYSMSTQYFLSDKSNKFLSVSKKNFYKLFSRQDKQLSDYLNNNTVHFNKEEDLLKLLDYLQKVD